MDVENLRRDLRALAERKLDEATFKEKYNVISKLNVRIYPSEDLKTMRVRCSVNLISERDGDNIQCGKIIFAPPLVTAPELLALEAIRAKGEFSSTLVTVPSST